MCETNLDRVTSEVWKWLGKNCSLYRADKVLYTECQIWPWPMISWPNSIGFLLSSPKTCIWSLKEIGLKLQSLSCAQKFCKQSAKFVDIWPHDPTSIEFLLLHVKFESDWVKTAVCIMPTKFYTQSAKGDLYLWPRDTKSIGFPFHHHQLRCEVWKRFDFCIVSTRFYTQSAKVDLDLWSCDKRSKAGVPPLIIHNLHTLQTFDSVTKISRGFLSSSPSCMWSLKEIGLKLQFVGVVHKVLYTECQTWPLLISDPTKFEKKGLIKVGEWSEPRQFWKKLRFLTTKYEEKMKELEHLLCQRMGGGAQLNPLVPPLMKEGHVPPAPPTCVPLLKGGTSPLSPSPSYIQIMRRTIKNINRARHKTKMSASMN